MLLVYLSYSNYLCTIIKKSLHLASGNRYFSSNDWKVADTISKSRKESFLKAELVSKTNISLNILNKNKIFVT